MGLGTLFETGILFETKIRFLEIRFRFRWRLTFDSIRAIVMNMNMTQRRLLLHLDEMPRSAHDPATQQQRVWGFLYGLSVLAVFCTPHRANAERAYAALCTARLVSRVSDSGWRHLGRLLRGCAAPHHRRMDIDTFEMGRATPQGFVMRLAIGARAYTKAEMWPEAASYSECAHTSLCVLAICRLVTPSTATRLHDILMHYASKVKPF